MYVAKDFMKLSRRDCEKQLKWIDEAFADCCIDAKGEMRDNCGDLCFKDKFKEALEKQGQTIQTKVPIFWRGSRAKFTALASSGSAKSNSNYIALEGTIWGAILDSVQNDPEWKTKYGSWLKDHTEWPVVGDNHPHGKDRSRGIDGTWKVWDAMSASLAILAKPSSMRVPIIFGESAPSVTTTSFNHYGVGVKEEMKKVIESSSNEYVAIDVYGQRECVTEHISRAKQKHFPDPEVCTKPWKDGKWTCEQELKIWAHLWANVFKYKVSGTVIRYFQDGKVMRITNVRQKQKYFTCVRGGGGLTVADINDRFGDPDNDAANTPPGWPIGNSVVNEPVTTYTGKYLDLVSNRFHGITMKASQSLRRESV